MFRRSGSIGKQARDLGVKFCDGSGISTSVERSARRLEAARTAAVLSLPRI
ncbi:hypothetical protein [Catenulispora rubra]|uniref:hypothetical protein n=1 Tax=Catenulispora rubra TaxID=280293 RepID=UPI00189286ED|nr:hypothetical protein [Catenulispora rubra]